MPSEKPASTAHEPTLLPSSLAVAVSAVTQTTGSLIRVSSALTTWSMNTACATTVSGLGIGMSFVESALCYAGRDVAQRAGYPLATAGHVEPVVEGSLDALYRAMTCAVFAVAAGVRLSTAVVETSAQSSLVALTVLNQFFGSTDSSRAMAGIIALVRREFRNPATGAADETVGVKELLVAIAAFAYLQNTCARAPQDANAPRLDEIVWDVVVLDDGARVDVHDMHELSLAGAHPGSYATRRPQSALGMPTRSRLEDAEDTLRDQLMQQLPASAKVVVATNTVTTKTITVDVPRSASLQLAPPPGAVLVQQASMPGPASDTRRVVYRIQRSESTSATAEHLADNLDLADDFASMENELDPRDDKAHVEVPAVRPITEVLSRPGTAVAEQASTLIASRPVSAEEQPVTAQPVTEQSATQEPPVMSAQEALGSPVALKPALKPAPLITAPASPKRKAPDMQSPLSPSKISRLSFLRPADREKDKEKEKEKEKDKKEKRSSLRSAFKLAAPWSRDADSPSSPTRAHMRSRSLGTGHAKLVKKRRPPPSMTQLESNRLSPARTSAPSTPRTTALPMPVPVPVPVIAPVAAAEPAKSVAKTPPDDKPVGPAPPVPRTPSSAIALRPSNTLSPLSPSSSTQHQRTRSLGSRASLSPSPAVRRSQLLALNPSVYSLNTSVPSHSQSSLLLYPASAYHQRSAYNPATLTALRRTGCIDPAFPRFPMLRNVTRYILFSSAAYGAHFLRYLGLAPETRPPRFSPGPPPTTHRDIRAFAAHTGLSPDAVLLASFVDASGGSTSDGTAGEGSSVPLVHYIALDHASQAVVLACRGTLGFEDVLADLTCDYADMAWRGQTYRVHKGIHASARRLLYGEDGRVLAMLKAALDEFPTYGLVLTGHSLGGAVTALLGVMLAEPNSHALGFVTAPVRPGDSHAALRPPPGRPIHVYAYGAPSTMCRRLQKATRGLITSVVHGNDVVPYLSLGVLHDFQALSATFKAEGGAARAALTKYITGQVQHEFLQRWYGRAGTYEAPAEDRIVVGGSTEWAEDLLRTLRAAMQSDKLLPPGEVFVVESTSVLRRDVGVGEGFLGAPAKRIVLRYVNDVAERFKEMRFRPSMLMDHSPSRYEESLNRLRVGVEQVWT